MKKLLSIPLMLLIISTGSFSQQTDNPASALTKQDYLKKSKNQKTAAWILLATGTAMVAAGSIIWSNAAVESNDLSTTKGTGLFAAGLIVSAGSIPLYIIAGKNKRKAMSMSFKMQQLPQLQNSRLVNQSLPSINLRISL